MKAERMEADLLILGGGASGCSAALRAHAAGAKVLMIVKGKMGRSGATPLASGIAVPSPLGMPAGMLRWLKTPYSALADFARLPMPASYKNTLAGTLKMHSNLVDQDYWIDCGLWIAQKFMPELEDKGLYILRNEDGSPVMPGDGATTYLFHSHGMTGYQFGESRRKEVLANRINVIEEASAFALMTNDKREVTGALVWDNQSGRLIAVTAQATILATGHTNWLSRRATGTREMAANGLAMAARAGAELQNLEIQWFHGSDLASPPSWMRLHAYPNPMAGDPHRVVMKTADGETYMRTEDYATRMPYIIQVKELYKQIQKGKADWSGGTFADFGLVGEAAMKDYQYHWEFYEKLGKNMARDMFECGITWHLSGGGVRADLKTMATRVAGLFIAGPVGGHSLGGLGPSSYDGEVAAEGALKHVARTARPPTNEAQVAAAEGRISGLLSRASPTETNDPLSPIAIKTQIREIVWDKMMFVKTEAGLTAALGEFAKVRKDLLPRMRIRDDSTRYNVDLIEAFDVEDMLDVCELVAHAAQTRKESRGPHFREDYPYTDDENWLKVIVLSLDQGRVNTRFEPVQQKYVQFPPRRVDYLADPYA